jgi:hypothetical protein
MYWHRTVVGKHPDLMVGQPTWTVFPTNDRNFEISQFFAKNFEKGLNQNIDQKANIWSKPSKDRNFLRKK